MMGVPVIAHLSRALTPAFSNSPAREIESISGPCFGGEVFVPPGRRTEQQLAGGANSSWSFATSSSNGFLQNCRESSRRSLRRKVWKTSFRDGPSELLNRGFLLQRKLSQRPMGEVNSALVTEVGEADVKEVGQSNLDTRQKRPQETYFDQGGNTKLISVYDYMEQVPIYLKQDGGPPRWFSPLDARGYPSDAPLLLFIPGMDSVGLGILLHQRKLARLFEVRCLHIPLQDRTSFVGLVEIVEALLKEESAKRPGPIYLLGESFGGSLALSVAARNPQLDLVLVLVNPATCFDKSPLQPLLPLLPIIPPGVFRLLPFAFSFTLGDPIKMASAAVDSSLPPWEKAPKLADALTALLPTLPTLSDLMPRETLNWKLKLLADGAKYANSRIRGVKADILLLASGKDQLIPSADEARRLKKLLPQTKVRHFKDSGHTLLLEEGVELASLIKASRSLRHSKKFDDIRDFRPPFPDEIEAVRRSSLRTVRQLFSPIFLSVTENGQVRKGLPVLPEGRPLLFVGNHTFIGFDLGIIVDEFYANKNVLLRGLAHPILSFEGDGQDPGTNDVFNLFGAVPVTGSNLYRLLAKGEAALLYPGGVREALKRKGEEYKLIWSEKAEFVRTAIRHGATIIPFASVGGDDLVEIVADADDLLSVPLLGDYIRESTERIPLARTTGVGEVANEQFILPLGYPKLPPRMYFLYQQPINTEGMEELINNKEATNDLYMKVKAGVQSGLDYVLRKRSEDPYGDFPSRVLFEATNDTQAPTFEF